MSSAGTSIPRHMPWNVCVGFLFSQTAKKGDCIMTEVRNLEDRKVCAIDPGLKMVVISIKGIETCIVFHDNGTYDIKHRNLKNQ